MDGQNLIPALLQKAWEHLRACDADAARLNLEEALKIDFGHPEVVYALKCVNWWLERIKKLDDIEDAYEKGSYILGQVKQFYHFVDLIGGPQEPCFYAARRFAFSEALFWFQDLLGDGMNQHDPALLLQVGQCYKGVGNYDLALKFLLQARMFRREDGETLSELADVYALLENRKLAKAFFREAFFLDPQGVELRCMESEMIVRLRDRVMELGYAGEEVAEWIPVYGRIFGVFTVKRGLKPLELARLKQSIFSLENELRVRPDSRALLVPRLINRYLWLLDQYENVRADPGLIEETMLKIKIIDPEIHERIR